MKRFAKFAVVALFAVISGIALIAGKASGAGVPVEPALASETPRSLYINNCARCHGADGKGLTETGKLYDVPDISGGKLRRSSTRRLTNLVVRGKGSMPAFGKKLTRAQINSLAAYVRSL
jgi:mono/diheme cytochrome c family protein